MGSEAGSLASWPDTPADVPPISLAALRQTMHQLTEGLAESRYWHKNFDGWFETYLTAVTQRALVRKDKIHLARYTVKKGDNFWIVAKRRHIDIDTIVGANPYLPGLFARLHQRILLINRKGVLHQVEKGESVERILDRYNRKLSPQRRLDRTALEAFNALRPFTGVKEGDIIFIPSVVPQQMCEAMRDAYALTEIFNYPLARGGRYSSFMGLRTHPIRGGKKFHNGVDIAVPRGTRVCAARSGVVVESGWKGGYGKVVVLRHEVPNGQRTDVYETLYGHNAKVLVSRGRRVKGGQVIALAGSTGMSTGPHLHFTIWKNGRVVDPLKFLWR